MVLFQFMANYSEHTSEADIQRMVIRTRQTLGVFGAKQFSSKMTYTLTREWCYLKALGQALHAQFHTLIFKEFVEVPVLEILF